MSNNMIWASVAVGAIALAIASVRTPAQVAGGSADWDMISERVAGTGGSAGGGQSFSSGLTGSPVVGNVYLFNRRTGKVYRVFHDCGDDGANGCITPLSVVNENVYAQDTPTPTVDGRSAFR